MAISKKFQESINKLIPADSESHFSESLPNDAFLLEGEINQTDGMIDKRKNDFIHGRYCARKALMKLGKDAEAIYVGKNREPIWPEGVTGSISHSEEIALAVVAHKYNIDSIGIDIESSVPLEADLAKMILRSDEKEWSDPTESKILFSIKESIYKCIFPQLGFFVDFQEMKVLKSELAGSFLAAPQTKEINAGLSGQICGRYLILDRFVISSAWIKIT
ncbi:MAG: 4'-phosphopantetheinyl transferase superfamily protein [Pseudomonadota bacterium]|nr:4'-phosphopantetheinyl transferase superfamily protein [Pseudomonadota bacterium]